jgi:hypothetical protein
MSFFAHTKVPGQYARRSRLTREADCLLDKSEQSADSLDMPPIDQNYMKTVVYLYASESDAMQDRRFRGTGFVISLPVADLSGNFQYLVTNDHVLQDCKRMIVARFTHKNGGLVCVRIPKSHWVTDRANDLAVAPVNPSGEWDYAHVGTEMFITPDFVPARNIGPGDEVYLISRTVTVVKQKLGNFGTVRFGNVAMNPNQTEPYFLVELRSVSGHSGSPVFLYDLPHHWESVRSRDQSFHIVLLGVNCGHIRDYSPILSPTATGQLIENKKWVAEHHISIAQVEPAWKLMPLLNHKKFVEARNKAEETAREQMKVGQIVQDSASQTSETEK